MPVAGSSFGMTDGGGNRRLTSPASMVASGRLEALMKSHTVHLTMNVPARMDFVNITRDVEKVVADERGRGGAVPRQRDAHHRQRLHQRRRAGAARGLQALARAAGPVRPQPERYHHNRTGEDNGDAHHKRQIMGREVVVAVTEGQARLRALGADLLRRVRRPAPQARAGQGHRRVEPVRASPGRTIPARRTRTRAPRRRQQPGWS